MTALRTGLITNAFVGAIWTFVVAISAAIVMSFATACLSNRTSCFH